MTQSPSIKGLSAALVVFHLKVESIRRDAKNPYFKKNYASLSNILESIDSALNEAGLSYVQFPEGENGLTTMLMHAETGEWIQGTYEMRPVKDDPQARGSVLTYQRRYALSAILGLNILEDDDGNAGSHAIPPAEEKDNKTWLNKGTPQYNAIINRLSQGTTSIKQIREHYKVSKEMETALAAFVNEPQTV